MTESAIEQPKSSSNDLLRLAIAGDRAAFAEILGRHSPDTLSVLVDRLSKAGVPQNDARDANDAFWRKFGDPKILEAFSVEEDFREHVKRIALDEARWVLADLVKNGNESTYDSLCAENWSWTRQNLPLWVNEADKDDVTQITWIRILAALRNGKYDRHKGSFPSGSFRRWVSVVARNSAISFYRLDRGRTKQLLDRDDDGRPIEIPDLSALSPERAAQIKQEYKVVAAAPGSVGGGKQRTMVVIEAYDLISPCSKLILALREGLWTNERLRQFLDGIWWEALGRGVFETRPKAVVSAGLQGPADECFDWSKHLWLHHARVVLADFRGATQIDACIEAAGSIVGQGPRVPEEKLLITLVESPAFVSADSFVRNARRLPPAFYEILEESDEKVKIKHAAELFGCGTGTIFNWHRAAKDELRGNL